MHTTYKMWKGITGTFFLLREPENCILSRLEWTKKVTTLLKQ